MEEDAPPYSKGPTMIKAIIDQYDDQARDAIVFWFFSKDELRALRRAAKELGPRFKDSFYGADEDSAFDHDFIGEFVNAAKDRWF